MMPNLTSADKKELERMFIELKKTLKPMSKNDLIRMVSAILVDNYVLKAELDKRIAAEGIANEVSVNAGNADLPADSGQNNSPDSKELGTLPG